MDKKKVLFSATVDRHILSFHIPYLRWFQEHGWEVHVASRGGNVIPHADTKFNIPFSRRPWSVENIKSLFRLVKIMREEKYDVVHTHTPMGATITRLAALFASNSKMRMIYTAHGFHFYNGSPKLNWLLYYPVEKFLAHLTDVIITINDEDFQLSSQKFRSDTYFVNGVGLEISKFSPSIEGVAASNVRDELQIPDSSTVLIYTAELSERKNQKLLLEAFSILKPDPNDVILLLVGSGDLEKDLKEQSSNLGLQDAVRFLGYRDDVPQLLAISDICVSTSRQEGLPVNILEGLAMGLPVVATDVRGNRDLVEEGVNGFLARPTSAEDVAYKLQMLIENKSLCQSFGAKSKEMAQQYSLTNVLPKVALIYQRLS